MDSEALQNLVIGDFGKVRLVDNRTLDVTGMGDRVLKTPVSLWLNHCVPLLSLFKEIIVLVIGVQQDINENLIVVRVDVGVGDRTTLNHVLFIFCS